MHSREEAGPSLSALAKSRLDEEVPRSPLDLPPLFPELDNMTLPWTIGWLAASLVLTVLGIWRDRRPLSFTSVPLVPGIFWLGLGIIGIVLGLAHLISLLSGVELHGRGPY
ncbi:MAG TPA: hypothetical protein VHL31_22195 [Geminicoccus sp.]|jgi:hypothetical protein|uniref:hypothetical protein n=1 Tax=Geminicoccus sp. TaxID=2024832 RepID=UPI002E305E7D|nr:hypothetical protein [Geminicoccus sp.]HEX2528993.1 hypothetical protein [Geminicoccus sp.]